MSAGAVIDRLGVHELTRFRPGDSAIMHGHVRNEQHCGIRRGPYSHVASMQHMASSMLLHAFLHWIDRLEYQAQGWLTVISHFDGPAIKLL